MLYLKYLFAFQWFNESCLWAYYSKLLFYLFSKKCIFFVILDILIMIVCNRKINKSYLKEVFFNSFHNLINYILVQLIRINEDWLPKDIDSKIIQSLFILGINPLYSLKNHRVPYWDRTNVTVWYAGPITTNWLIR